MLRRVGHNSIRNPNSLAPLTTIPNALCPMPTWRCTLRERHPREIVVLRPAVNSKIQTRNHDTHVDWRLVAIAVAAAVLAGGGAEARLWPTSARLPAAAQPR